MLWIFGIAAMAIELNAQVAPANFSCKGRGTGYYADVTSGCQVYHMCDGLGRQFSYTCPNATLFQQRMLICDHWYMVNCSKSESDYNANLRIGQREMPFVDDSEAHPYHRTPRPDLLSHPSPSEADIIYRTGRKQFGTSLNLVGAESDPRNNTPDESTYNLPSHWSTEYSQQITTLKPLKERPIKKEVTTKTKTSTDTPVNYKSYFKNTTPVFPRTVDVSTESPDSILLPPLPYQAQESSTKEEKHVNFQSHFKATTPVYPKSVEQQPPLPDELADSIPQRENSVNFESSFKATTPVYPLAVENHSEEPSDAGVQPPLNENNNSQQKNIEVPSLTLDILPPKNDVDYHKSTDVNEPIEVQAPSMFYQAPNFEPDYTQLNAESRGEAVSSKPLNTQEWVALRQKLLIPDYDFPLESVSRPSYDTVFSSFEAKQLNDKKKKK